ncbi:hypothetical protein [Bacillus mojavensis]
MMQLLSELKNISDQVGKLAVIEDDIVYVIYEYDGEHVTVVELDVPERSFVANLDHVYILEPNEVLKRVMEQKTMEKILMR